MPDTLSRAREKGLIKDALRLAKATLKANTKIMKAGLMTGPGPCLMAGLDYPTPWTRDAAINTLFAAAEMMPDIAKNTLLSVLEIRDGEPCISGQYWDRIIWALGAEKLIQVTGDPAFTRLTFDAVGNTIKTCLREEFDPADGLFRGPAVYGDGVSAYPEKYRCPSLCSSILKWSGEHPKERAAAGYGIPMKALSTNCVYERAFRALATLADTLGEPSRGYIDRADALKGAVNRAFWNGSAGTYDYLAYECGAQEGLGLAFAILFDIADEAKTKSVLDRVFLTPHGIPCVYPAFAPYDAMGYGRHCGTVWPHVQGFFALAALKAGRRDLFDHEFYVLAEHAVRDGQFAEIYHPEDGRVYGGIQEGGGEYLEWRSCSGQTWSAAAFIAMARAARMDEEDL